MSEVYVYIPRAVAFQNATHEGGGGTAGTVSEALALGATNIREGNDESMLVADWPQKYWAQEPGPSCPCGAHTCAGSKTARAIAERTRKLEKAFGMS